MVWNSELTDKLIYQYTFILGKRGRPKVVAKEESDEVVSAEENGIGENDVDSKADKGGSSTEEEVDSKTEEKVENGNSSAEEEKKDEVNLKCSFDN